LKAECSVTTTSLIFSVLDVNNLIHPTLTTKKVKLQGRFG